MVTEHWWIWDGETLVATQQSMRKIYFRRTQKGNGKHSITKRSSSERRQEKDAKEIRERTSTTIHWGNVLCRIDPCKYTTPAGRDRTLTHDTAVWLRTVSSGHQICVPLHEVSLFHMYHLHFYSLMPKQKQCDRRGYQSFAYALLGLAYSSNISCQQAIYYIEAGDQNQQNGGKNQLEKI